MQRALVFLLLKIWKSKLSHDGRTVISIKHVAHKEKIVKNRIIKYCWSSRQAQLICATTSVGGANASPTQLAYSYIGGGVTWQPPATYALVSRGMPLHVADRYLALVTFLAGGAIIEDMFVRKQNAKVTEKLTVEEKTVRIRERVSACGIHLRHLRTRSCTVKSLLTWARYIGSSAGAFDDTIESDNASTIDIDDFDSLNK